MGVDVSPERVQQANLAFPDRQYFVSRGENLELFTGPQFSRVISNMALPYMDIPKALAEMYRVLLPGGKVSLTLHRPTFTLNELTSCRSPKAFLYRLYVLAAESSSI